ARDAPGRPAAELAQQRTVGRELRLVARHAGHALSLLARRRGLGGRAVLAVIVVRVRVPPGKAGVRVAPPAVQGPPRAEPHVHVRLDPLAHARSRRTDLERRGILDALVADVGAEERDVPRERRAL